MGGSSSSVITAILNNHTQCSLSKCTQPIPRILLLLMFSKHDAVLIHILFVDNVLYATINKRPLYYCKGTKYFSISFSFITYFHARLSEVYLDQTTHLYVGRVPPIYEVYLLTLLIKKRSLIHIHHSFQHDN